MSEKVNFPMNIVAPELDIRPYPPSQVKVAERRFLGQASSRINFLDGHRDFLIDLSLPSLSFEANLSSLAT